MRRGVHFLMEELAKHDQKNNWESKFNADGKPSHGEDTWNVWNCGGETGLALYALLHVGQGVTEDEELGGRLKFNSKELGPVVKWLAEVRPDTTYSAGLQSSALGLIPKDTENYKAAQVALRSNSFYLSTAMNLRGGYTYAGPIAAVPPDHRKPPRGAGGVALVLGGAAGEQSGEGALPSMRALAGMAGAHFRGI